MYHLFFMEQYDRQRVNTDQLLVEIAKEYGQEYKLDVDNITLENLRRTPKGKPYFEGSNIHFSISHSKKLFAILMGTAPCGIDLQVATQCQYEKIAKRHFTEREEQYVGLWGKYGFFTIWTMREAFGKMTGQGFYGNHPQYITEKDQPLQIGNYEGKPFRLENISIGEDIFCACCVTNMDEISVGFLN